MIRRIAYVSRPVSGLSLCEIPRIVSTSRAHNDIAGIGGVLIFTGLEFAQLIEGPSQPVAELWDRIRADSRHCDLVTLFDERALTPWYSDWRTGFPSDSVTAGQIAAWRRRPLAAWDEQRRGELRLLLSSIDAI